MAENNNQKEVLIKVTSDTTEVDKGLEGVRGKIEEATGRARELSRVDYGSMSVKELKEELDKAEQSMEQLAASGNATADSLEVIGDRVETINGALKGIEGQKSFEQFRGSVMASTGAVEALEGAMTVLGIQNKEFEETVQRLMGIRAFKDGIDDVFEYGQSMKGLITNTNGAVSATKLLRVGLSSLGIGLLITAVSYLVTHWDSFKETIMELFPELEGLGKWFSNIQPILMGVGNAVIQFVLQPIRGLVDAVQALLKGDWKEAGDSLLDAINPVKRYKDVVNGFKEGYANQIAKANAEKDKEIVKSTENRIKTVQKLEEESLKEYQKLVDEAQRYIAEAQKEIADRNLNAQQLELQRVSEYYLERINKAREAGLETADIEEALRQNIVDINEKYAKIDAENAAKAEAMKIEAEARARRETLERVSMEGETSVLNAETADDGTAESINRITEARLEALNNRYVAELALYEDDQIKRANITAKYEAEKTAIVKDNEEQQRALREMTADASLKVASNMFASLSALAGEQSKAGKAFAVAQATIDTYSSAVSAYGAMSGIPVVGPVLGAVAAAAAVVAGLANVRKIMAVKADGKSTSTPSTTTPATPRSVIAPTINSSVINRGEVEDLNSLGDNSSTSPIRAYIVDRDIEESTQKNELTDKLSTF